MRALIILFLLLFAALIIWPAFANEITYDTNANRACFEGMYEKASGEKITGDEFTQVWATCLKAAKSGAAGAQNLVGMGYLSQNKEQGIYWLNKAAAQGHTGAIEKLESIKKEEQSGHSP